MSLIIATENTYTAAQLEALVESPQLSSSFLSRLRSCHFLLTPKFSLMKSLFDISTHFSCLLSAIVVILLVHANTNLIHLPFNDYLTCIFQASILLLDVSVHFHRSLLRHHPSPWKFGWISLHRRLEAPAADGESHPTLLLIRMGVGRFSTVCGTVWKVGTWHCVFAGTSTVRSSILSEIRSWGMIRTPVPSTTCGTNPSTICSTVLCWTLSCGINRTTSTIFSLTCERVQS